MAATDEAIQRGEVRIDELFKLQQRSGTELDPFKLITEFRGTMIATKDPWYSHVKLEFDEQAGLLFSGAIPVEEIGEMDDRSWQKVVEMTTGKPRA